MSDQLVTSLPDGAVAVSAAKTLETGVRASLLKLPNMVRIDLRCIDDTVHLLARSLGPHGLVVTPRTQGNAAIVGSGLAALETFDADHVVVDIDLDTEPPTRFAVQISILLEPEEGLVHVTGQGRLQPRA